MLLNFVIVIAMHIPCCVSALVELGALLFHTAAMQAPQGVCGTEEATTIEATAAQLPTSAVLDAFVKVIHLHYLYGIMLCDL